MSQGSHRSQRLWLQMIFFWLMVVPSPPLSAENLPSTLVALEAALDEALAEVRPDFLERLTLVDHADQMLAAAPASETAQLGYKTRLVQAGAYLRLGRFEASRKLVDPLCDTQGLAAFPVLRFRCRSLRASLMLINGERLASLSALEALLGEDLDSIPGGLRSRAQINYATVLNENGRAAEAADLYEQIMVSALADHDDQLTLYAANNLCVILVAQGDYVAARRTLDEMLPVMVRAPNAVVNSSLRLLDYELIRIEGDPNRAIGRLQAFIDSGDEIMPLMLGSAHKTLADALRDVNRFDEAERNARRALELLRDQAHEHADARLALTQILAKRGDFEGVLAQLDRLDLQDEVVPTRLVQVHRLRLEALLQLSGANSALVEFEALIAADGQRDKLASTTRAEYYEALLIAAQRGLELEQAEALAASAVAQNRTDARNRNLSMALVAATAIGLCLLFALRYRRLAEQRRLVAQQEYSEALEARIARKTQELTENLSARADMERALERKKRTEAVGLLAGNVAHDFNNLLQVIATGNEMLAQPQLGAAEKSELLALSKGSLDHASRIIRQLLAYSRQQDLAAKPTPFSDFLNDTQTLLRTALGEKHQLAVEDDSGKAMILVDSAQLTTSLLNLMSNAADAMPIGGSVTLSAQVRSLDVQQAKRWSDVASGDYLVVGVRDDGVGMTEGQVARAHEPFFTTKDAQSGTGLGLSSVYGFVKQSGGDLKIHSVPNEGTLVQFLLPITARADQPQETPGAPVKRHLSGQRMLLVEDHDTVAGMLEALLSNMGLRVVRVASGQAAQAHLQKDSGFDFILSDVNMPGALDGPGLARWTQSECPGIRVFLMSGFSELDANDADLPLIRKPFNAAQLLAFIGEHNQAVG